MHHKCCKIDNSEKSAKPETEKHRIGYHSERVKFIHPSIETKDYGPLKGIGLYSTSNIKFGEIVLTEYPLFTIPEKLDNPDSYKSWNTLRDKIEILSKSDERLKEIWLNEMCADQSLFQKQIIYLKEHGISIDSVPGAPDYTKYQSNKFGILRGRQPFAIYGLLSKINFGLPQNIACIFGEEKDNFVVIVIATKDINKGEELVSDYFFDWMDIQSVTNDNYANHRKWYAQQIGIKWNDRWDKIVHGLTSKSTSQQYKHMLLQSIYSHGIIGLESGKNKIFEVMHGCQNFEGTKRCVTKRNIARSVHSRLIFDVVKGRKKPPKWTGKSFRKIAKQWRQNN